MITKQVPNPAILKERLKRTGRTQTELVRILNEMGFRTTKPKVCEALGGIDDTPKTKSVLIMADEIVSKWESEADNG